MRLTKCKYQLSTNCKYYNKLRIYMLEILLYTKFTANFCAKTFTRLMKLIVLNS